MFLKVFLKQKQYPPIQSNNYGISFHINLFSLHSCLTTVGTVRRYGKYARDIKGKPNPIMFPEIVTYSHFIPVHYLKPCPASFFPRINITYAVVKFF